MRMTSIFIALFVFIGCKNTKSPVEIPTQKPDFTIAFGSCNKSDLDNFLWDDIVNANPDVWIWGGDIVYADTDDMQKLRSKYDAQNEIKGYKKLKKSVQIVGTWDDHDYGLNDGGVEFTAKKESQQQFLDFIGVSKDNPRRFQEGIYTTHDYKLPFGMIKVIVLDTRYFRTALTPDTETDRRTKPNAYGEGTVLGETQWKWLENTLTTSTANFNVIISSIQFLSNEHGFECWGNFPHEVDKLKTLISDSKAKGVHILSGDRHISEFSKTTIDGMDYPLIDFTSSGLTHAYSKFSGEPNPFRIGSVISTESFGLLHFNFLSNSVDFSIVGDEGIVLSKLEQQY